MEKIFEAATSFIIFYCAATLIFYSIDFLYKVVGIYQLDKKIKNIINEKKSLKSIIGTPHLSTLGAKLLLKKQVYQGDPESEESILNINKYFVYITENRVRDLSVHYMENNVYFKYVSYTGETVEDNIYVLNEILSELKKNHKISFWDKIAMENEITEYSTFLSNKNLDLLTYSIQKNEKNTYGKSHYQEKSIVRFVFVAYFTFVFIKNKIFNSL